MPGSRSNIDVYLSLKGQRKFAKEVEQSGAELESMGLKGAKSMAAFAKSADKLKKFGASWTRNVSAPIAALAGVSVYAAVNFKRQMGLIATDAGGTAKEVAGLEPALLSMARTTQYSGTELAEALFHAESAGYRGAKALKVVHEAARLATAGNSELEATTYGLVSAQKALYGGQDVKNVRKTASELNAIVSHGDIRLEELVAGMSSGLIEKANEAGVSLRSVGSALDVMTARGIPAQRASYALGFIFSKLVPTTEPAEEAFAELGLSQESLLKKAQGPGGWPAMIKLLNNVTKSLPSGQKQTDIAHMFGGGRMDVAVLASLQNMEDLNHNFKVLNPNVALYMKHTKEAEEQPLVKLKRAWGSVQDSLVEIGDELVPVVVPALEKMAAFGERAANFFMKIPGPVKLIGIGALLLTGPVATGLGFFASGVGRTLILLTKLGRISQNVGIFAQAMKAGQGVGGSAAIGFSGFGKSAALETAKGFAYSLGPMVAAAGIGNIVYSATQKDWKGVGFEAGGALAGGILGFMVGGPMGAMLGGGLGSFGGKLLEGLFGGHHEISEMQRDIEALGESSKRYHEALKAIPGATERVTTTSKRHATAVEREHRAEHVLVETLARFGAETRPATQAQVKLDRAQRAVTRSARAEKNAHREAGNALKVFRMRSVEEVAQIKQVLPLESKRIQTLNRRLNREPHNLHLAESLLKLERHHHKAQQELIEVYAEAESKAGKPWTKRLETMSSEQAKYGEKGKTLVTRLQQQRDALKEMAEAGVAPTLQLRELREEMEGTAEALGQFNANTEGLGPKRLHPQGAGGKHHPSPQRMRPGHHKGKTATVSAQARKLSFTSPSRLHIDASGSGRDVTLKVENHNVTNLDGKTVAANTTTQSKRASLRR